jgi:CBS domain-containing protein
MSEITVMQAKRFGVITCAPETTLLEAAQRMVGEDIGALVVVDDDGALSGIITRTDLLRASIQNDDWQTRRVHQQMNRQVVAVDLKTPLRAVTRLLVERGIHRVVVVRNEDGKLRPMAVVSSADLVYHLVKEAAN